MNRNDSMKLDALMIDDEWENAYELRGEYDATTSDPLIHLETKQINCLSFALIHQALVYAPRALPILGLFRAKKLNNALTHFFNLSMVPYSSPRTLYDESCKAKFGSFGCRLVTCYFPKTNDSRQNYLDFMMSVVPGETDYGERIEIDDYELTYCNPEYVLEQVCSTEGVTMQGLARAARERLAMVDQGVLCT